MTEIVTSSRTNLLPERERISKVLSIEVVHSVTLPFKGEDSVGAKPNTSIHPRGKMNSEEGKTRVRNLMRDFTELIRKHRHLDLQQVLKTPTNNVDATVGALLQDD